MPSCSRVQKLVMPSFSYQFEKLRLNPILLYTLYSFSTTVGAIRLFFISLISSLSLSLASRFVPATLPAALLGVSGGVVMGTPWALEELVAVKAGTLPAIRVGLLTTPVGTDEDCVAIDDVELERVGDAGRCDPAGAVAGGDGAVNELAEFRCW